MECKPRRPTFTTRLNLVQGKRSKADGEENNIEKYKNIH